MGMVGIIEGQMLLKWSTSSEKDTHLLKLFFWLIIQSSFKVLVKVRIPYSLFSLPLPLSFSLHININWDLFVNSPMKFTLKVSTTNLDPQKPRFDYNELLLLCNIYVLSFGSSITRTVLAATNSVILISKYCPLAGQ